VLGALVAVAGIGLTLWAVNLLQVDSAFRRLTGGSDAKTPSYWEYLKHTSFGAWAMLLAFLLCLIAAMMGPKRAADTRTGY
jgi:putative copper export protein